MIERIIDGISALRELSVFQMTIINIGVLILIGVFSWMILALSKRKYKKCNSVEDTLYYMNLWTKYGLSIMWFISLLFIGFMCSGLENTFITVAIIVTQVILGTIVSTSIFHDFHNRLRKVDASLKSKLWMTIKSCIVALIPLFLIVGMFELNITEVFKGKEGAVAEFLHRQLTFIILIIIIVCVKLATPFLVIFIVKGKQLKKYDKYDNIREELEEFMLSLNIKKSELYLWEMKDHKIANAFVTGLNKKNIYLTDYLMEKISIEEIKAILAHEIGHIKGKHIIKRIMLSVLPIVGISILLELVVFLIDKGLILEEWIIITGFIVCMIIIIVATIIITKMTYRKQEKEADKYVLSTGIDGQDFMNALYKLARLNHMKKKLNKVDEKFQTHPSIANRIRAIEKECGVEFVFEEVNQSE